MSSDIIDSIKAHAELFDVPGHAVIATTLDGRIVFWSDSATDVFGWQRADVIDQPVVEITPAPTSADAAAEIMAQLKSGRPWSGKFSLRRKTGETFVARVSNLPVHDEDGTVVGIIGVTRPLE